jgi:hypothetical protein
MLVRLFIIATAGLAVFLCVGCSQLLDSEDKSIEAVDEELQDLMAKPVNFVNAAPPSPITTIEVGPNSLTFWPYTGDNFFGTGQDPINLIFFGNADPRDIRAALLALDGDRSAFGMPPFPPFNSQWDDAIGNVQVGYGEPEGWTGGCVQLACGDYGPLRFHLRLFKMGDWTVGNAHFELLIPGTTDHQVLSWEVAEQFVIADFIRSGLLDIQIPMMPTAQINESPWRTIPAVIYNEIPVEVRALIGGPLNDVENDIPIGTDGHAMILNVAGTVPCVPEIRNQDFVVEFGQVIPKPFCASGPDDYVYVQGPVHLVQTSSLTETGEYHVTFRAEGQLTVTPVNPFTGEPIGETLMAEVIEHHDTHFTDNTAWASSLLSQHLLPDTADGAGRLFVRLQVRSDGRNAYTAIIRCADNPWEDVCQWNLPATMQEPTIAPDAGVGLNL